MPTSDAKKSLNFLKRIREGTHNIVGIHPSSGQVRGITRQINVNDGMNELLEFIEKYNGTHGLYYSINTPKVNAPDDKLKKEHIESIAALFIDADPVKGVDYASERERLKEFSNDLNNDECPPSFIIDSGGGHQAIWLLDKPIDDFELAESYGRGLAHKYGTDAVQNIDRLLRLPFTLNIPSEKKKERGRVEAPSRVIHASQKTYAWDILISLCDPLAAPEYTNTDNIIDNNDFNMLTPELKWSDVGLLEKRFYQLMESDSTLLHLIFGDIELPSRSEYDFLLASRLKGAGWSLRDVAIALWLNPFGKGKELTAREITRCYDRATNPFEDMKLSDSMIDDFNQSLPKDTQPTIDDHIRNEFAQYGLPAPKHMKFEHNLPLSRLNKPMFEGFMDQETLTVMYGQSNVGKSFAAMDIAGHLAAGKDWAGYKCKERMGVLYVSAEAGRSIVKRERAMRKRLGIDTNASYEEFPFSIHTKDANFFQSPDGKRDDAGDIILWIKMLEAKHGIKIGMVVIDTLATSFAGGNENSGEDMTKYLANLKRIEHLGECAVDIVHHSGKDQAAGARGHSSLRAATDTEIEIKADKRGNRWFREINVTKQRDAETGISIQFGLKVVEIEKNTHDDIESTITTCCLVLSSDTEFDSVIPSLLDGMEERHKMVYASIMAATYSGDNNINNINAWYMHFTRNPFTMTITHNELQTLTREVSQKGCDTPPISANKMGSQKNVVSRAVTKLEKMGIVRKGNNKQWFIE